LRKEERRGHVAPRKHTECGLGIEEEYGGRRNKHQLLLLKKKVKVESNGVGLLSLLESFLTSTHTHKVTERHGGRGKGMREREQILFRRWGFQVFCLGGGGTGLIDGSGFLLFFINF
jgi:hypothetical protein